ncbi:ImmA/IrrE family metallo-endopeptidase [Pseudoalteromonas phenolica]|uniref:ImmA/IrrE family metallo-endopeptidase n=1 Tax=Pseudoalteromonas phenolica TaxID=161398 RepID=UPI00384F6453
MELADLTRPSDIVDEILKQNPNISFPIPLETIAEVVGIRDIRYTALESLEGALVANEEKSQGIIVVNQNTIPTKQRFTVGHELGHFLIPRHGHNMQCSPKDLKARPNRNSKILDIESEANLFSSKLLMPAKLITQRGFIDKVPSFENILNLKSLCDVSLQACANNYINLHGDHLAIIISKDKKISYGLNCNNNPLWLNANKGSIIPIHSHTASVDLTKVNTVTSSEVDIGTWFSPSNRLKYPETIIEETLVQENGWAATLLWIEQIEEI